MLTSVFLILAFGAGQSPPPSPPPAAVKPPAEQVPAPSGYRYNPEGRRDPFVSLVNRGSDLKEAPHGGGITGVAVQDVTVKGVIQGPAGFIAMVQGPDNKTYIVRPGDRFLDGVVKAITRDGVIFSQDVNDPLSTVKQRDIEKRIRTVDGRG
jgi:type IV pilus assembly protein PilP